MPDRQPPVAAPTTNPPPCQPQPTTMHLPIGDAIIQCGPPSSGAFRSEKGAAIPLTITFKLASGLSLNENVTLSLLYIVNGSLDYSTLFSQTELSHHGTVTFQKGQAEASFTLLTLPVRPNTTFELEVLAYAAGAGTIISGAVRAQAQADNRDAEDKSLKALNALATTALVTALGALAFALLRSKD